MLSHDCHGFRRRSLEVTRRNTLRQPACVHWTGPSAQRWLAQQRASDSHIIGVELVEGAIALGDLPAARRRTVAVLGHEHSGIPTEVLDLTDSFVEIPMVGYRYKPQCGRRRVAGVVPPRGSALVTRGIGSAPSCFAPSHDKAGPQDLQDRRWVFPASPRRRIASSRSTTAAQSPAKRSSWRVLLTVLLLPPPS